MIKDFTQIELGDYFGFLKSGLSRLLSQQDIGLPVLISGNIKSGRFNFDNLKYWYLNDPQGANTNNYILEKGDILLCFINSLEQIGKLAIFNGYERPCIYTTNLFRIKAKPEFDSYFLYYLLSSQLVQSEIKAITKPAVNQASFTTVEFQKIKVPFINLGKQKKIAKILSTVDNVIEKTESAIAKYQAIKQGLMHNLFTRGIDVHTGKLRPTPQDAPELYKESVLGLIPRDWVDSIFKNYLIKNLYGPRFSGNDYDSEGNVKTIRGMDFSKDGEILYSQAPIALLPKSKVNSHLLEAGDVVMVTTADCGLTAVFEEQDFQFIPSAYSVKFRFNEEVQPYFIKFFMQTDKAKRLVNKYVRQGTLGNLPGSDVLNFNIGLPKIDEQKLIIKRLKGIESKIQTEQQALAKYQQLKSGLLQDLLTGTVEVSVD